MADNGAVSACHDGVNLGGTMYQNRLGGRSLLENIDDPKHDKADVTKKSLKTNSSSAFPGLRKRRTYLPTLPQRQRLGTGQRRQHLG